MSWKNTFYKDGRWRWSRIIAASIGGFILMVIFAALFGLVVQALWNWIMPGIFSLREITYPEAFGLMLLARLLFGHVGGKSGGNGGGYMRHRHGHGHHHGDWGEYKDWRHYNEWWNAEGKEAFKKFAESRHPKDIKED